MATARNIVTRVVLVALLALLCALALAAAPVLAQPAANFGNGPQTAVRGGLAQAAPRGLTINKTIHSVRSEAVDAVPSHGEPPPVIRYFSVAIGQTVTYRLVVRNHGPGGARGVRVRDDVPSRLDVTSASSSQADCSVSGNRVRCEIERMTVGQAVRITIRARAIRAGDAVNGATVTSETCASKPCDKDFSDQLRIFKPEVDLVKNVGKGVLRVGGTATYTILAQNTSFSRLRNLRVCERLPAGLVLVSAKPAVTLSRGRHCWTADAIGPEKLQKYRMTVRALPGACGRMVSRTTASATDAKVTSARVAVRVICADPAPAPMPTG